MQLRRVAYLVEASRLGYLPVEQCQDMAESRERADVGFCFLRQTVGKPRRNPLDKLTQNGVGSLRWSRSCAAMPRLSVFFS